MNETRIALTADGVFRLSCRWLKAFSVFVWLGVGAADAILIVVNHRPGVAPFLTVVVVMLYRSARIGLTIDARRLLIRSWFRNREVETAAIARFDDDLYLGLVTGMSNVPTCVNLVVVFADEKRIAVPVILYRLASGALLPRVRALNVVLAQSRSGS